MESIAAKAPASAATAEKVLKKTSAKASVQKGKILEVVKEVPLDPMAKKLCQERCRGRGGYMPNKLAATSFASTFTQSIPLSTSKFVPPIHLHQHQHLCMKLNHNLHASLLALLEGFIFSNEPYAITFILRMMKLRYKNYRFNLHQHFRSFPTMEFSLTNPHEDIEKEVWRCLCQLWDDKTYQEKCQKNKENQFELKVLHTADSKAFRKVQYDEQDKDGKELGLVHLYHKTHFSQKRQAWVHNEVEIRHIIIF